MALSATLPEITAKQEALLREKGFWRYASIRNTLPLGNYHCLECGAKFSAESVVRKKRKYGTRKYESVVCPECGQELKVREIMQQHRTHDLGYYCIVTTVKQYIVLRYITCEKICKSGSEPHFTPVFECVQNWIDPSSTITVVARARFNYMWGKRIQNFVMNSDMEIRRIEPGYGGYVDTKELYMPSCEWVVAKRTPMMRKYDRKRNQFNNYSPADYYKFIMDPMVQTLIECGYNDMLRQMEYMRIKALWNNIKICLRHNYHTKDWDMWRDNIHLLERLHMDSRNVKYVCPDNLFEMHNQLMRKENRLLERKRQMDMRRRMKEDVESNAELVKQFYDIKGKFFDIDLKGSGFHVIVLDSPEEYWLEGEAMHHCVGSNGYWKQMASLILSARDEDGKRLATIELNLNSMKIIQCRGVCNDVPKQNRAIRALINNNINLFEKAKEAV